MKLVHDMPKLSNHLFVTYYLHLKKNFEIIKSTNKLVTNSTQLFDYATNFLYFLYNLGNLLTIFLLIYNSNIYIAKPSLITKRGELPKTYTIYTIDTWNKKTGKTKTLSLFISSTLIKIRPAIFKSSVISKCMTMFKYMAISKYTIIFKYTVMFPWQLSSTLTSFWLLTDYSSIKIISKAFPNFSYSIKTVKLLLDNDTINFVIYYTNAINKANIIYWCKQMTHGILAAELYTIVHRFDNDSEMILEMILDCASKIASTLTL